MEADNESSKQSLADAIGIWTQNSSGSNRDVEVLQALRGGTVNQSFLVSRNNRHYVVRIRDPRLERFPRAWKTECYAAKLAADIGVAPEIEYICDDPEFMVCRHGGWSGGHELSPRQLVVLAESLAKMHQINADTINLPEQNYVQLVESYIDLASQHENSSEPCLIRFRETRELAQLFDSTQEKCFTHHDLVPDNLLWKDGQAVIIDWEYACFGHPNFDLATIFQGFALDSADMDYFLQHYADAGGTVDSNEKASSHIEIWKQRCKFIEQLSTLWCSAVAAEQG